MEKTKKRLQISINHIKRVNKTLSGFVGKLEPFFVETFEIIDPDEPILITGLDMSM
ncbi:MAG: hypothetical protein ACE5R6_04910 [Candidatus Heimdallarchaeota archaeon]